jgi:6-phosphogluconate dehydrogenase
MQLAMIGLGPMGANMARRLMRGGHAIVVYDQNLEQVRLLEREGAVGAQSLDHAVTLLSPPRALWLMVPAGSPTEATVNALAPQLASGDVLKKLLSAMPNRFGGHREPGPER